jgi:hypothetical protein
VLTNPVPFTVKVNPAEPALTVLGVIEVATGCGLFTVNVTALDVPPPGAGFVTVTAGVPAVATSPAKIAAVTCVALTNVVTRAVPPKFTTDVFRKLVPFTVNVNAPEPAITFVGASVVMVGTGFGAALTLKFTEFDVPPPGVGFVTVTAGVPILVTSVERIAAVSCVALTKEVTRALPPKFTTDVLTKFVPFTVKVSAPEFTTTPPGESELTVGTGFAAAVTLKLTELDVPPPGVGFVMVTAGVPVLATSAARICAVTCVALTNDVVLFAPPKLTVAPLTKFVPFTVSVNAPEPAATPVGDKEVTVGTGFVAAVILKFTAVDVPPPGVGFVTVTAGVPTERTSAARIEAVN